MSLLIYIIPIPRHTLSTSSKLSNVKIYPIKIIRVYPPLGMIYHQSQLTTKPVPHVTIKRVTKKCSIQLTISLLKKERSNPKPLAPQYPPIQFSSSFRSQTIRNFKTKISDSTCYLPTPKRSRYNTAFNPVKSYWKTWLYPRGSRPKLDRDVDPDSSQRATNSRLARRGEGINAGSIPTIHTAHRESLGR